MAMLWVRTLTIYLLICAAVRLMGKRQLGELQPSELVTTILISNLASIPIESPDIPLLSSVIPVLIIVCLEVLVAALCSRSHRAERLISGSPQVLIQDGVINQQILRQLRFSVEDLLAALRLKDVFDLSQVALCLVETNGSLSVCKTSQDSPPSCRDLRLSPAPADPLLAVWIDGVAEPAALCALGKNEEWCRRQLEQRRLSPDDVLVIFGSTSGNCRIIKREAGK